MVNDEHSGGAVGGQWHEAQDLRVSAAGLLSRYLRARLNLPHRWERFLNAASRRHFSFPASFDVLTGFSGERRGRAELGGGRATASQRSSGVIQIPSYRPAIKEAGESRPAARQSRQ